MIFPLLKDKEVADARVVTRSQSRQRLDALASKERRQEGRCGSRKSRAQWSLSISLNLVMTVLDIISHNIAYLQMQDVSLQPLFDKVGRRDRSFVTDREQFVVKDEKLYRQCNVAEKLVVPTSLRLMILKLGHSTLWAGHLGQQKTLARVASRFYWPRQYMDIVEFCNSCPECQLSAPIKKGDSPPLVSLPIIDEPFARIAINVVGPLERSWTGNRYILVVCDYAIQYPEAFPVKKVKTRQIFNALTQLFSRVGIPREILLDQGTNFMSK